MSDQEYDLERRPLDPSPEDMRQMGYQLVDQMVRHSESLSSQPVIRTSTPDELREVVDEPLPEQPCSPADCVDDCFERIIPGMTRVNHPRFHAYIPAPSSFAGSLGLMIAAATNPFAGTWLGGATFAAMEVIVIRWIAEMLGYNNDATGILTSGGSMANLTALAAARAKWKDLKGDRCGEHPTIYVSAEGHASVTRAANVLGFPPTSIRVVPVNNQYRLDTEVLRQMIQRDCDDGCQPVCVVGNAGTTNLGVIDPLSQLADICQSYKTWFHVDAAYGGFAALTERGRILLDGMNRADSLTLDPHKWLYCPMGTGCILVRDEAALRTAFSTSGDYLRDLPPEHVNLFEYGPELSRPARALPVWMVIRSAGRRQLADQIESDMRLARMAAELLSADDRFDVIPPELSVVGFRHRLRAGESESDRSERDAALMQRILDSGDLMLSTTLINARSTLRMVVMNHRTTEADIRFSVGRIREFGR